MKRWLAVFALFAACTPGPDIDPAVHQQYLVYDWNGDTQTYELHPSRIETLDDPREISGSIARLRGGGSLVIHNGDPESEEGFANALEVRHDKKPSAEYYLDGDVVVPYDFDTQMMVTLYHHLERAHEYFAQFDAPEVGTLPAYYFPQVALFGVQLPLLTDNAAYAMTLDAFLIPPTLILVDGVPLSANRGVIVHEYGHAVFNRIVFGDDRAPNPLWDPAYSDDMTSQLRSLDEGLADTFGALATGASDFIGPSISSDVFEIDRDLAVERIWDSDLQQKIDDVDPLTGPNPYILGSVVASALWATRDFQSDEEVAATTLAAMERISMPGPEFRIVDFFNAWLAEVDSADRDATCAVFSQRLELIRDQLDCPL